MKKGFTLFEILVVLLLVSILFGVVISVVRSVGQGSLVIKEEAEKLREKVYLAYRLKHQLEGLKRNLILKKDEENFYLAFVTSSGEVYPGVVKVRYRFSEGKLFYCESLYTFNDLLSCEKDSETLVGHFKSFKVKVFYRGRWYPEDKDFSGIPEKVKIFLDDTQIIAEIWIGRKFR